ncbi:hypothetical protein L227DRAFT_608541 [Lentinus tigrinus ALCF2SS1-6]|uniref:DUF659 domain-containing protein n=1 Tax=Lentinus tigrinus ALCF2SS1-6 TaxID=1328759 RepID=A0A5C2SHN9_9APHY|nr:hypothetical protein L227DRAFT_608541 [Lentinus tigrinus ALCF2SS1-6]
MSSWAMSKSYGKYLAEHLVEVLKKFGIDNKICGVTVDNATNNTTMLMHMTTLISGFWGVKVHVRCFSHILNIVLKGILLQFKKLHKGTPSKKGNNNDDDYDGGHYIEADNFSILNEAPKQSTQTDKEHKECKHRQGIRELEDPLAAIELDCAHDANEEDDRDDDREVADNILIDTLNDEHPELMT